MQLQESGEMHLETILILSQEKKHVRSLDIAENMSFSKPSVSRAVGLLKNGGFVTSDVDGYLALTEAGAEVARKMDHDISDRSFEAIKRHARRCCKT